MMCLVFYQLGMAKVCAMPACHERLIVSEPSIYHLCGHSTYRDHQRSGSYSQKLAVQFFLLALYLVTPRSTDLHQKV